MTAAIVVSEASKKRNVKVSEDESGKKWNAFSVTPHELLKSADAPLAPLLLLLHQSPFLFSKDVFFTITIP